jgi:hypothetical protein
MKNVIIALLLLINSSLVSCQNSVDGNWKSKVSDLELVFDDQWKLIQTNVDDQEKVLVGLVDQADHSSFTVKITRDVPKDQLSDELYFESIKE